MSPKKRGLGRGLDALLTSNSASQQRQDGHQPPVEDEQHMLVKGELQKLPIEQLQP